MIIYNGICDGGRFTMKSARESRPRRAQAQTQAEVAQGLSPSTFSMLSSTANIEHVDDAKRLPRSSENFVQGFPGLATQSI